MGMPALLDPEWTADLVRSLPDDGNRYEVLDGELCVTPAPASRHQAVVEELFVTLRTWAHHRKAARVRLSPADIEFSPRRLLQPDLYAIPWTDRAPSDWSESRALVLAVEVLSPATARADRHRKRRIYQSERVDEYWIVDPEARLVERWRPDDERPEIIADILRWSPLESESLELDLTGFFRTALGDESTAR